MRNIGRYRVDRPLGTGAFATVWLGHDEMLDAPVAIKVLADNWAHNADVRERFLNEARLMRRIRSAHVVKVHDVGVERDMPYFVMDLVPGGTLGDIISERFAPHEAMALFGAVASAVQSLHDEGILHRDLKPSNLLLARVLPDPFVVVADLGTAKLAAEASMLTMAAGTPAYMAPELAFGTDGFDERADVYALGVIAAELLTGRRPLEVRTIDDVVHLGDRLPAEVAAAVGLPEQVDDLLAFALSPDRGERPASAADLARRLELALAGDDACLAGLVPTELAGRTGPAEVAATQAGQPLATQVAPTQVVSAVEPAPADQLTGEDAVGTEVIAAAPPVRRSPARAGSVRRSATTRGGDWPAGWVALVALVVLLAGAGAGWLLA